MKQALSRWLTGFLSGVRSFPAVQRLLRADLPTFLQSGYRIEALLSSPYWPIRNVAVKLLARFRLEAHYPALVERLADPGEVPIVRRNCVECLAQLHLREPRFPEALRAALRDPYWEVRTEALKALAKLEEPSDQTASEIAEAFFTRGAGAPSGGRLRERNFEVLTALAAALGRLGRGRPSLEALRPLAQHRNWIVRAQAATAVADLVTRTPELREPGRQLLQEIEQVSEGAWSYFVLQARLRDASGIVERLAENGAPSGTALRYLDLKEGWLDRS